MKSLVRFINESKIINENDSAKTILSKFRKITMDNIDDMDSILDECAEDLDCLEGQEIEGDLKKIFIDICKNNHIKYNKEYLHKHVICVGIDVEDIFWEVAWYRHDRPDNCDDVDYAEQLSDDVEFFIQKWFAAVVEKYPEVFI